MAFFQVITAVLILGSGDWRVGQFFKAKMFLSVKSSNFFFFDLLHMFLLRDWPFTTFLTLFGEDVRDNSRVLHARF